MAGDVVAFGKLDPVADRRSARRWRQRAKGDWPAPLPPLFSLAVHADKKQDEVKLSGALTRLVEEDPSLSIEHNPDTGQLVIWGQGEIHLQVALETLRSRFNLGRQRPAAPGAL